MSPRAGAADARWVAVADLHGHLGHFKRLLEALDHEYGEDYRLCTLGDYVDNGEEVPALLDFLIELAAARGARFMPILGNHDLALLRTLGWPGSTPDEGWMSRWRQNYMNAGLGTPSLYGRALGVGDLTTAAAFAANFPSAHRTFLAGLPWVIDTGRWLFVHAGMQPGPLAPQVAALVARALPAERFHLPPPVRDKALSRVADPSWDRVVVSAHNKHLGGPRFVGPQRVCLSGEVDARDRLFAVVLGPERRYLSVDEHLRVAFEAPDGSGATPT